ncbi:hypothetical protein K493DRAFT_334321 [Basidiobolus meristosporus CBS 931.73]|uniref:Uncharacterized protein n=1 Tax=Basidiobolus meristosporus CBS 931.73 TaxID=1314790 RepID=A0A1Y1YZH0_9FUNG|nr:hypothetical protein K493DRAFT_334321 [Basidiobolus meristosporus CBS 931.73]|eukprot:ORY03264.1 hypothetical protein K493DRAFT_334321 [Basidiobolus meristosporus CBS 931.73]
MVLETVQGVVVKIQPNETYVYPSCGNCNAKLGSQPGFRASPGLRRISQILTSPSPRNTRQGSVVTPIKTLHKVKALTPGPQMHCSRCHSNYSRELSVVVAYAHEHKSVTVFGDDLDVVFGCNATEFRKFLRLVSQKAKLDRFELKDALLESLESVILGQLFALTITRVNSSKTNLPNRRIPLSDKTSEYLSKLRAKPESEDWRVRRIWPVYGLPNSVFSYLRERLHLAPGCLSEDKDIHMLRTRNLRKTLEESKQAHPWFCDPVQQDGSSTVLGSQSSPFFDNQSFRVEWEYGHLDEVDSFNDHVEYPAGNGTLGVVNPPTLAPKAILTSKLSVQVLDDVNMNNTKANDMENAPICLDAAESVCQQDLMSEPEQNTPSMSRHNLRPCAPSPSKCHTTPKGIDQLSASQTSQFFQDFYTNTPGNLSDRFSAEFESTDLDDYALLVDHNEIAPLEAALVTPRHQFPPQISSEKARIRKESCDLLVAETPENPEPEYHETIFRAALNDQTPTKSQSFSSLQSAGYRRHSLLKHPRSTEISGPCGMGRPTSASTPGADAIIPETPVYARTSNAICINSPSILKKNYVPETPAKETEAIYCSDDEVIPPSDEEDMGP